MDTQKPIEDSLRPEYDLTNMRGVVRGKHARAYHEHLRVVRLSDDVASAFKTEDAVNAALRDYLRSNPQVNTGG
ncbi:MAG: hypothetical protein SGI77_13470 [Pirellulaceae bacterium]|nr:hypothetical protein [Pirellulaceae bacterium]